jgi:hypothetical protein
MQAIIIAIITTVVGVVLTILISRHYYGRSAKHRLAIYEFPFPEMLSGVDPDTRHGLTIKFHDTDVKALNINRVSSSPMKVRMRSVTALARLLALSIEAIRSSTHRLLISTRRAGI